MLRTQERNASRKVVSVVSSKLRLSLLSSAQHRRLVTGLAALVGTDPFALDGPGAEALVVWVVSSKVAVLDQATPCVTAVEVDDLVLYPGKQ